MTTVAFTPSSVAGWDTLDHGKFADETATVRGLLDRSPLDTAERAAVLASATDLVERARRSVKKQGVVESFLQEFSLGTREGLALMCLAEALLRTPDDWRGVADYVGEQLSAAAHTRAADEALEEEDRRRLLGTALKMIADGTEPSAENFSQFEPVRAADGRIGALRFVFPPYQVGPYADGVRTVDVPAQVLRPWLADDIRGLFSD